MMRRKIVFMWHIFIFNFIKLLPCSTKFFNRYFVSTAQDICENDQDQYSRYMKIVNIGKERFGRKGALYANIALMSLCLPISIAADYFIFNTHNPAMKLLMNIICFLLMTEKFDILYLHEKRNFLKLLYICYSFFTASYWSITCLFLVAFENIV